MNANPPTPKHRFSGCYRSCLIVGLIGGTFAFLVFLAAIPFVRNTIELATASKVCFPVASIDSGLDDYAAAHQGNYPTGKSSTEIFQSLLDDHYLNDPSLFYFPMPGKVRATTNHLKPENVCWDVTSGVDSPPPEGLPMIFMTGYKVTYRAGASAVLLPHPSRSWSNWWNGINYPIGYIAVCYKNSSSEAVRVFSDGSIPNFIPADFDPKGKTYRQLTPDGELPP